MASEIRRFDAAAGRIESQLGSRSDIGMLTEELESMASFSNRPDWITLSRTEELISGPGGLLTELVRLDQISRGCLGQSVFQISGKNPDHQYDLLMDSLTSNLSIGGRISEGIPNLTGSSEFGLAELYVVSDRANYLYLAVESCRHRFSFGRE
jgi:hypothetical protein